MEPVINFSCEDQVLKKHALQILRTHQKELPVASESWNLTAADESQAVSLFPATMPPKHSKMPVTAASAHDLLMAGLIVWVRILKAACTSFLHRTSKALL